MAQKKQSQTELEQPETNEAVSKQPDNCEHSYFVTQSFTTGGLMKVRHVRCSRCLKLVDLEQLEWQEENE